MCMSHVQLKRANLIHVKLNGSKVLNWAFNSIFRDLFVQEKVFSAKEKEHECCSKNKNENPESAEQIFGILPNDLPD